MVKHGGGLWLFVGLTYDRALACLGCVPHFNYWETRVKPNNNIKGWEDNTLENYEIYPVMFHITVHCDRLALCVVQILIPRLNVITTQSKSQM